MADVRDGTLGPMPGRGARPSRSEPWSSWLGLDLSGGRYHVTDMLGEGGPGVVYRAHDRDLGRDVAIEVPRRPLPGDPVSSARFVRAIRGMAARTHPHLVRILDAGVHHDAPFAVEEYLPGGSLKFRRRVGPDGSLAPMDPQSLAAWLPDVAGALDFLHAQGHVHRDVRPANILFDAQGKVYLGGLGTGEGVAASAENAPGRSPADAVLMSGPPGYMAPEQIMGQAADGRADQYALAVIVYEWLSGRSPFEGPTATAVLVQQATREPPELHRVCATIPGPLSAVVQRGLSRDPRSRFPDCSSFARAVLAAARGEAVLPWAEAPEGPPSPAALAAETRSAADARTDPDSRHWLAIVCSATIAAACVLGPRRAGMRSTPRPTALVGRTAPPRSLTALGSPPATRASTPAIVRDLRPSLHERSPSDVPAETSRRASLLSQDATPGTRHPAPSQWWLGPAQPPRSLRRFEEARRRACSSIDDNAYRTSRP